MAASASGLLGEIVTMSWDTLRANKMRSALTVLGVVIGITSIVGMTSLIRGFDESLRDSIRAARAQDDLRREVQRPQHHRPARTFVELLKRPNLTPPTPARSPARRRRWRVVDIRLGRWAADSRERVFYRNRRTQDRSASSARPRTSAAVEFVELEHGPVLQRRRGPAPAQRRRAGPDAVLSAVPEQVDPIGKKVRVGVERVHGHRRASSKRPEPGRVQPRRRRLRRHPVHGAREAVRQRRRRPRAVTAGVDDAFRSAMIAVVPREGVTRDQAMDEVERSCASGTASGWTSRTTSTCVTQDAVLKLWDQFSQATFLALVVISLDRADGRRHRRHGDHDDHRHRADARDRRPQGARRAPPRRSSGSS